MNRLVVDTDSEDEAMVSPTTQTPTTTKEKGKKETKSKETQSKKLPKTKRAIEDEEEEGKN